MANMYMVAANIVEWEVGADGNAAMKDATGVRDTFEDAPDDRIKLKLLAKWLKNKKDAGKDIDPNLVALMDGLVTVEIESRSPVKAPEVPTAKAEAARREAFREAMVGAVGGAAKKPK